MWIFHGHGYLSVIQHRDDKDLLLIRARVKGDLENLKSKYLPNLGEIVETPMGADYPYRALAWRVEFAEAMKKMALAIDYTNFKNGVSKTQGAARHDLYMRVWSIMKSAEDTLKSLTAREAAWGRQAALPMGSGSRSSASLDDRGGYQSWLEAVTPSAEDEWKKGKKGGSAKATKLSKREEKKLQKLQKKQRNLKLQDRPSPVDVVVAASLRGTEFDYDRDYADDPNSGPSNYLDAAEGLLELEKDLPDLPDDDTE